MMSYCRLHSAAMLSDPRQRRREGKPERTIKEFCVRDGLSNPNWLQWRRHKDAKILFMTHKLINQLFWSSFDQMQRYEIIVNTISSYLIITMVNFLNCAGLLQPSLRGLLRKHTHTHTHLSSTSERGFWSISFFHQSLSEWGSYLLLSYLYSRLMGKFKFGITSACWPESISDNWPALHFHYSHASKHHTTKSHTLLSRDSLLPYLKSLCLIVLSVFRMHEDRN